MILKPYVQETQIKWVEVELPISFQEILKPLKAKTELRIIQRINNN